MTELFTRYLACTLTMGVLALGLFALSPALGKRYKARTMYIAWVVAALGFLLPLRFSGATPAYTAKLPASLSKPVFAVTEPAQTASVPAVASNITTVDNTSPDLQTAAVAAASPTSASLVISHPTQAAAPGMTWQQLTALVWLIGACASLLFQLTRHALFLRTVRRWQKPVKTAETLRILAAEKQRLGIRQNVQLLLCPSVNSPMMIGLVRPRLLLPDEELTADELPLVFRHELTHLKRRDLWVKALLLLVMAVHWFNPVVYLLGRSLVFWQEASCDERVTAMESNESKQFYSETIIRVIRRQTQLRSAVTTSFYGGKNGMKRRILTILQSGKKRIGAVLLTCMVALTAFTGMAFAISASSGDTEKDTLPSYPTMYIGRQDADGAPMLWAPTVNDIYVPVGAYYNGTPVSVTLTTCSSALDGWGCKDGEDNWAQVLIGGNGVETGISGWVPLLYLSDTPSPRASGTLQPADDTGYVNLYQLNMADSPLLGTYISGKPVTLLGMVGKWWQVEVDGVCGFVSRDDVALSDDAAARLTTFRPDRFDTSAREDYRDAAKLKSLYEQKAAEYGGLGIERWMPEDKAWYSQVAEALGSETNVYYLLPEEGELSQEEAVRIAWETYQTLAALTDASLTNYETDLALVTDPTLDIPPRQWRVDFRKKGEDIRLYTVVLDSTSGEIAETWDQNEHQPIYDNMKRLWETQKGAYADWSPEDKAAFSLQYGDGMVVVPDEKAITQQKAEELAPQALREKYDIPDQDIEKWSMVSEFRKDTQGSFCWQVDFYNSRQEWLGFVALDAYTGAVVNSQNPAEPGNG